MNTGTQGGGAPLLVLSPHFDDAVLSCWSWLTGTPSADVLTIFGGAPQTPVKTHWDGLCGYSDSDDALHRRRAEEAAAFRGTAHRISHLDLLDGQYAPGPRCDEEITATESAIETWIEGHTSGVESVILAPAGAGRVFRAIESVVGPPQGRTRDRIKQLVGPVGRRVLKRANRAVTRPDVPVANDDHRFVRDAAIRVARRNSAVTVWLYEEVPYLWGSPADGEVATVVRRNHLGADLQKRPVDRVAKAQAVAAYASQLRHLYAPQGPLDSPEGLPAEERYWRLSSC